MSLSVCYIVKDEEAVLKNSLSCAARFADEIVVVDTGSVDRTVDIAKEFTDNVYFFPWNYNFSAARNFSFSKAHGDYVMWLDADDILEEAEIQKLLDLKERLSSADTFMLRYRSGSLTYYRERILRRCNRAFWRGWVHEAISPFGKVEYSEITVTHRKVKESAKDRNLNIYFKMQEAGEPFSPRDEFYFARELYYNGQYDRSEELLKKVISNPEAWIENKISACEYLAECRYAQGDKTGAKEVLLKSLLIEPRAELLCRLGGILFEEENYSQAVFYYRACLLCEKNEKSGCFCNADCYDYIPYIQICVCYFRLGNMAEAEKYNDLAGRIKPDDYSYRFNAEYFDKKLQKIKKEGTL